MVRDRKQSGQMYLLETWDTFTSPHKKLNQSIIKAEIEQKKTAMKLTPILLHGSHNSLLFGTSNMSEEGEQKE